MRCTTELCNASKINECPQVVSSGADDDCCVVDWDFYTLGRVLCSGLHAGRSRVGLVLLEIRW